MTMARKRNGVPALLERTYAMIQEGREKTQNGDKFAIYNPQLSRQRHKEVDAILEALAALIEDEYEPLLERGNPPIEKRLAEQADLIERLVERLDRLEQTAPLRFPTRKAE